MSGWLVLLLATTLLCVGLILIRKSFYVLAERTAALLNALLDDVKDEMEKQRRLITGVGGEMKALLVFLVLLAVVLGIAALPILFIKGPNGEAFDWEVLSTWQGLLVMLVAGTVPFMIYGRIGPKRDYNEWSMLLHRMVLDNQHLGAYLFAWDVKRYSRKHAIDRKAPILVSGLARAGTTALTTILARSAAVHSLTYASMPFLMAPFTWGRFSKPRNAEMKERSHGDKVLFGYDSVEALEEYFFKVLLKERYVRPDALEEHTIDAAELERYIAYRNLASGGSADRTTYLAKNNNALLRYASLRELEPGLRVVFLFRDPLDHAFSLMKQHKRFSRMQEDDPFVLEYMNWLGHHEFGKGLKRFVFAGGKAQPEVPTDRIEHWLNVWIAYYTRLEQVLADDRQALLIDYADFLRDPSAVVDRIGRFAGIDLAITDITAFENTNHYDGPVDQSLLAEARALHARLVRLAAH